MDAPLRLHGYWLGLIMSYHCLFWRILQLLGTYLSIYLSVCLSVYLSICSTHILYPVSIWYIWINGESIPRTDRTDRADRADRADHHLHYRATSLVGPRRSSQPRVLWDISSRRAQPQRMMKSTISWWMKSLWNDYEMTRIKWNDKSGWWSSYEMMINFDYVNPN